MSSVYLNKFSVLAFFIVALGISPALADFEVPGRAHDSSYEEVYTPVMTTTSIVIDGDETPPVEPNIGEATYIKYPALTSLEERVARLLFGIKTYIRPEYDHFGHEIRLHMSRIGNLKIYSDPDYMLEQFRNVKKAKVVADFWKKHLESEIEEIQKIMDNDETIPLKARTAFRQNKAAVRSFLMSLKAWIDSNEQLLRIIAKEREDLEVVYPEIITLTPTVRVDLHNALSVRTARLKDIRQYPPFTIMVY